MSNYEVRCNSNSWLPTRFINHGILGICPNIQEHPKNHIEQGGDVGLFVFEKLPCKLLSVAKDPRIVTVALTALALYGDSYLFYPVETLDLTHRAIQLLPQLPDGFIKFSAYIVTVETICSYGARALGRFSNEELMSKFYV